MKRSFHYEILFAKPSLTAEDWAEFLRTVSHLLGLFSAWQILVRLENYTLHFYLCSPVPLPASLGSKAFLFKLAPDFQTEQNYYSENFSSDQTFAKPDLKRASEQTSPRHVIRKSLHRVFFNHQSENLLQLIRRCESRSYNFLELELNFTKILQHIASKAHFSCIPKSQTNHKAKTAKPSYILILPPSAETLLTLDFTTYCNLAYKKIPKYLPTHKIIHLLSPSSKGALLLADTFPYSEEKLFLVPAAFDFAKHSLIIGSSGAGKSKFIALFIHQLFQTRPENYKVVVIDPHDNLKYDCTAIANQKIVDFMTAATAIDIFNQTAPTSNSQSVAVSELGVNVELTLDLLKQYFNDGYNGRLERVLRYSLFLLMQAGKFSFVNLRRLLLDADFRGQLVAHTEGLPTSVEQFFLTDFSELKTGSYNLAIAPIIAFIDEMQMVPLFSQEFQAPSLEATLQETFLTIFSLNRLCLGTAVTKIIAGLISEQLFLLAEAMPFEQHLIIIVDEVSVVESPIIARALSELRKYHVSIILAGQYLHQITPNLRESILANVTNYYIFRSSKTDAQIIAENIDIKIPGDDQLSSRVDLITKLKTRECLVRISHAEKLQPTFRATTVDHSPSETRIAENVIVNPIPAILTNQKSAPEKPPVSDAQISQPQYSFDLDDETSSEQLIKSNSTSRKKLS